MGFGAPSATPCLAGFFALRCFSLITIWVTPESWVVKPITSRPHWFYTRILRVPKCFSPQAFSLTAKSVHNLGVIYLCYKGPAVCNAVSQELCNCLFSDIPCGQSHLCSGSCPTGTGFTCDHNVCVRTCSSSSPPCGLK